MIAAIGRIVNVFNFAMDVWAVESSTQMDCNMKDNLDLAMLNKAL